MTSLRELADYIRHNFRTPVHGSSKQLILTLSVNHGRKQTVLISVKQLSDGQVIEIRSRCAVVDHPKMIRSALKRNFSAPIGGFAMVNVDGRHVLDCVQRLFVPPGLGVNISEFLSTVVSVGVHADVIEGKRSRLDVF